MSSLKETPTSTGSTEQNWHARDFKDAITSLGSSRGGLTIEEVLLRHKRYGKNAFTKRNGYSLLHRLGDQFKSPLTIVLLVASGITFALGDMVDTVVILFALGIAIIVGVVQEGRASRAFMRLATSQLHSAIVVRDGRRHEIDAREVVPGDVVILQSGMQIPADIRLMEVKKLAVNEASLTGEWLAVKKDTDVVPIGAPLAEQTNMAWKGTFIADGYGTGVVIATGDHTEVGKLARELAAVKPDITPLQWEMQRLSRTMFYIIAGLVVFIFAVGILRGEPLETMLITGVAIAVASIPEGLPAAVTIVLAISMEALLNRGGLVRNLLAAETLGATTFILTDKTGTLTEGRMTLADVIMAEGTKTKKHSTSSWAEVVEMHAIIDTAVCASDAFIERQDTELEEAYIVRGEPMERAILETAVDAGLATEGGEGRGNRIDYLSFTSENRFAAGLTKHDGTHRLCINGAPEYLLEASMSVLTENGVHTMTAERRSYFTQQAILRTKKGERLIGVAYRDTHANALPDDPEHIMDDLVFMGLLVFHDPVRTDVVAAIKEVMSAGVTVRLVTGDNPETALSVARAVGIAREHDAALTGTDIMALSDRELFDILKTTRVFARVLPRQKLRLAQVLQKHGEIVAMTGDGINDAPALLRANIGIALGSGTEVAKEASDLVLVNDTFATIHAAIEEGRRIIDNLQKIVGYLLSTSVSEAILIGAALIVGMPLPIVPVQILWANIIEEGLMSVAFAFEPADKAVMRERPRDIHEEGILSKSMLLFIALVVGVLGVLLLSLYAVLLYIDMPLTELRSVMFLIVSLDSLFIAFSFRELRVPIWRISFWTNRFFIASFVLSGLLLGVVLTVPFMQKLLSYEPLPLTYVLLAVVYGFISMMVIEIGKYVFFEHRERA